MLTTLNRIDSHLAAAIDFEHEAGLLGIEAEELGALMWRAQNISPERPYAQREPVKRAPKGAPKAEAVRRLLAELYPRGIPDQAKLLNKVLHKAVVARLGYEVSESTVLRVAGRRR